jgi:hypothetical protein
MMQWLSTPNSWSCTMWKSPSLLFISSKLYTSYSLRMTSALYTYASFLYAEAQTSNPLFIYTNLYFPTSFYSFSSCVCTINI